jgi:predicted short-subunit dehydrogenase-like oxidoreductase (DUF2520 family)
VRLLFCRAVRKPRITIVGPGRLGLALAQALADANYRLDEIVFRRSVSGKKTGHSSEQNARKLARRYGSRAIEFGKAQFAADVVWLCIADGSIASVARSISGHVRWKGKVVFHSSGALSSRELLSLREAGAFVASVHPMMSFVHHGAEATFEVPFALEGDAKALRVAKSIVRDLGGESLLISAANKPLYHAFGAFLSPLIVANLALAERIGIKAGVPKDFVRQAIAPILATTVFNYITLGSAGAFSGPIVRGDVETVRKNLAALKKVPDAEAVYRALARSALRTLPVGKKKELERLLAGKRKSSV